MPDKEEKTVNLDTSGPGARVELPETENEETKTYENKDNKNEANVIYDDQPADTSEKSSEQLDVRTDENNQEQSEEKKEISYGAIRVVGLRNERWNQQEVLAAFRRERRHLTGRYFA